MLRQVRFKDLLLQVLQAVAEKNAVELVEIGIEDVAAEHSGV